jgi:predicted unusual protein kinase regulating ubiquinone biosynthesis (AarF/ABC1/UbiB family)
MMGIIYGGYAVLLNVVFPTAVRQKYMARKSPRIKSRALPRQLSASLAGLRAGGALAVDNAWQKIRQRQGDADNPQGSKFARKEAQRLVRELGRLKGTYVKIGQMLALLGEHILPPVLTEALHELGSQTEPLDWRDAEPLLREALGKRYHELDIEKEAIAAASLAQVHRATIRATGEKICLKLQYPGLADVIDADFDAVIRMLVLARFLKSGRELDDWLHSLREHLHNEIDYAREADLHQRMYDAVNTVSLETAILHVPRLHPRFCCDTVLAMEYVNGAPITAGKISRLSLKRRNALAKAMLELFFYELYQWGLLQTDPNFGNYLVRLRPAGTESDAKDELVLLDFGSILDFEESFLHHFRTAIAAGLEEDKEALVGALIGLGCLTPDSGEEGRESFANFCLQLLEPLGEPSRLPGEYLNRKGEYCWARSGLMKRAGMQAATTVTKSYFTTPSREFALIARKLTGVFTFISVLEAEFNAHDVVAPHIRRWRENVRHH